MTVRRNFSFARHSICRTRSREQPLADLLQRARPIIAETESQANDRALPAVQLAQRRGKLVELH